MTPADPDLPYRPGVGAVLFNADGRVWIGRRSMDPGQPVDRYWQMPQGGIDEGETPAEAVLREVIEETGTDKCEIIAESTDWLTYDLPDHLMGVSWGGRFRGQTQKWFALRFTGDDDDFDLAGDGHPEFVEWRWVAFEDLPGLIIPFKRRLYEDILSEFHDLPKRMASPI